MARSFNGTTDYLQINQSAILAFPLSFACWFRTSNNTAVQTLFWAGVGSLTGQNIRALLRGDVAGDPIQAFSQNSGGVGARSSAGFTTGQWYHGTFVWTSTTSRAVYLAGGNSGTDTTASDPTIASWDRMALGASRDSSPDAYLAGEISQPCLWNVSLTADEAVQLAAGFHPSMVRPDAIVSQWGLNQGASPEPDNWGGYSLTLTGTSQVDDPPLIYPAGVLSVIQAAGSPPAPVVNYSFTMQVGRVYVPGMSAGRAFTPGPTVSTTHVPGFQRAKVIK